ncbi:MAG: Gfo/Idh/MocA family oxidoreductase [Polaromonas sp.]
MHYSGGAVAVVQATTAAYPGFPERIELNFTKGSATLESGELRVAFMNGKTMALGVRQTSGGGANPMEFDHAAHRAVLHDFIRAVRSGTAPAITGRSALGVQQVIEAIMESSSTSKTVALHPAALIPVS